MSVKLKKSKLFFLLSILFLTAAAFCIFMAFRIKDDRDTVEITENVKIENGIFENFPDTDYNENKKSENNINFPLLTEKNKDIYAWLCIPGTNIDYPIVQHPTDSEFYLGYDSFKVKNSAGAIFTESEYNSRDFSDSVTLIYGHKMRSGSRFGNLQEAYDDKEEFDTHSKIIIYMPEKEFHYKVFAAVPYSKEHILYKYDCSKKSDFDSFLQSVFTADGIFDNNISVDSRDKIIVLSTCLNRNSKKRFLVLAKQVEF